MLKNQKSKEGNMKNCFFSYFQTLINYGASLLILSCIIPFTTMALDKKTLNILHLLESKKYSLAVPLLEKEIKKTKSKNKKGYYSFLLNQLPANIKMKSPRYKYAFIAAQYAQNIPQQKHLILWIEAGDGFFKSAKLKKANYCYQKALQHIQIKKINQTSLRQRESSKQVSPSSRGSKKIGVEKAYILHKQAWININQKKWKQAYTLLNQAIKEKTKKLNNIILLDTGKIWVESQYFKNKVPLLDLETTFYMLSQKAQKNLITGMAQGLHRMKKRSLTPVTSTLSHNKTLSTTILNELLSHSLLPVRFSCSLIPWIEKTQVINLNKKPVFSILNSCAHYWMSKKKHPNKLKQLKRIVPLYTQFERTGMERWPLSLAYHTLKWHNKACAESLYQLTELNQATYKPTNYLNLTNSLKESKRFCLKAKINQKNIKQKDILPSLALKVTTNFLTSPTLSKIYKNSKGDLESALIHFFKNKKFVSFIEQTVISIKAHKNWKGKDFLPLLLLSNISQYQTKTIAVFMDHFSITPLPSFYLNILMARQDILTQKNLNKWLPLSEVRSYAQIKPYMKAFLSNHLNQTASSALGVGRARSVGQTSSTSQGLPIEKNEAYEGINQDIKKALSQKLLNYFPKKEKEKKEASVFLALYYLKNNQTLDIFKNWDKLLPIFSQKKLAIELLEKSILDNGEVCQGLDTLLNQKDGGQALSTKKAELTVGGVSLISKNKKRGQISLLRPKGELVSFIHQCCEIVHLPYKNKNKETVKELPSLIQKTPIILKSSALAKDFMFLVDIQKNTLFLEKNISLLEKRTSKMVMNLKKSVSRYQKRKWHLKIVAKQVRQLLTKQIDLFEKELNRLSKTSPYGKKYKELKKIVRQWR